MNYKNLNVAYIAKYAPAINADKPIEALDENAVYSKYHFDIYQILSDMFPKLVTATEASFILENHNKIDYVFSLLNRAPYRNSEIFVSSLLEYFKIPYLGARPNIRATAEDKQLAKALCKLCNIKTPNWICCSEVKDIPKKSPFNPPYFVKHRFGASSLFVDEKSICYTWDEACERTRMLLSKGLDVIIEEFIDGILYSVPVFFNEQKPCFLPPVCEKSNLKGNVVTYYQKRKVEEGLTRTIEDEPKLVNILVDNAQTLLQFISPIDYVRFDFIVTNNFTPYFIEFNVCCNLGKQSAFVLSANSKNISQESLVRQIVENSLKRQIVFRK